MTSSLPAIEQTDVLWAVRGPSAVSTQMSTSTESPPAPPPSSQPPPQPTAAHPTSPTTTTTTMAAIPQSLPTKAIIGAAVGGSLALILLLATAFILHLRLHRSRRPALNIEACPSPTTSEKSKPPTFITPSARPSLDTDHPAFRSTPNDAPLLRLEFSSPSSPPPQGDLVSAKSMRKVLSYSFLPGAGRHSLPEDGTIPTPRNSTSSSASAAAGSGRVTLHFQVPAEPALPPRKFSVHEDIQEESSSGSVTPDVEESRGRGARRCSVSNRRSSCPGMPEASHFEKEVPPRFGGMAFSPDRRSRLPMRNSSLHSMCAPSVHTFRSVSSSMAGSSVPLVRKRGEEDDNRSSISQSSPGSSWWR